MVAAVVVDGIVELVVVVVLRGSRSSVGILYSTKFSSYIYKILLATTNSGNK